jgi:ribosomal protein S3
VGQKTNPLGFRLITTQSHLSKWYSGKQKYSQLCFEDNHIRKFVLDSLRELVTIATIDVKRNVSATTANGVIVITITALYPRIQDIEKKFVKGLNLEKLFSASFGNKQIEACCFKPESYKHLALQSRDATSESLKTVFKVFIQAKVCAILKELERTTQKQTKIHFKLVRNPYENASLISKSIAEQLENRVPFRRIIKQTIKKVIISGIDGVKIQLSGRLNGIDIARTEWKREGKIPLHTLDAKIDFTQRCASTIFGVIGIKIWLYKTSLNQ